MGPTDLAHAEDALSLARSVIERAAAHLASTNLDANQAVAYDLAHAAAAVATARACLDRAGRAGRASSDGASEAEASEAEASLAAAFTAEALWDLSSRLVGREALWGVERGALSGAAEYLVAHRDPRWLSAIAERGLPRGGLDSEFELVAETFRRFADEKVAPAAERIHRHNEDVPEEIISGLSELGAFGLSVPQEYGGTASGDERDYLAMVVATEELSRASLAAGGSLITRPEILARALLAGGTEEQKRRWLPKVASGELMVAIAVTEPDFGSDVAGITTTAERTADGWALNGTKTWCTFAARADLLMVLARTDPNRSLGHRGLSVFVVPKKRADGRGFILSQSSGGRMEGRPIDTIGYRGMHSYELAFDRWLVPADHLVGEAAGEGRGFYLQMQGFENGRLQTAARAVGVMQAAYDAASSYAAERVVFGKPIGSFQLTQVKLARMAATVWACRQYMYEVARRMAEGRGSLGASMVKAYSCRAAEWVTREAMQVHGGMGYAEEVAVSRYFVDARVLPIFEGADETLALRVIARRLLEAAASDELKPASSG